MNANMLILTFMTIGLLVLFAVLIAFIVILILVLVKRSRDKEPDNADDEDVPISNVAAEDLSGEETIDMLSDGDAIGAGAQFGDSIDSGHTSLDDFNEIGGGSDYFGDEGETVLLSSEERISIGYDAPTTDAFEDAPLFGDDEDMGSDRRKHKATIFYNDDSDMTDGLSDSVSLPPAFIYRIATDERIEITKPEFSLGKSQNADYTVRGNNTISRVHIVVIFKDGDYYIVDNHSSNHTYVNETTLEPDTLYILRDGDRVVLSTEVFRFHRG